MLVTLRGERVEKKVLESHLNLFLRLASNKIIVCCFVCFCCSLYAKLARIL